MSATAGGWRERMVAEGAFLLGDADCAGEIPLALATRRSAQSSSAIRPTEAIMANSPADRGAGRRPARRGLWL